MSFKPLLSVIIPFYNRADLIVETLDSVLNQTFHDFELICVDDGSTDNVPEILATYAKKDPRVKVILKPLTNSGDTRNVGYRHSVGKYIFFLDSDDLFTPNYFAEMIKAIKQENSDVVICKYREFNHMTQQITVTKDFPLIKLTNKITTVSREKYNKYLFQITFDVLWNKLYKREIIDRYHHQFLNYNGPDDVYFVLYYLVKCQRITFIDESFINYRNYDQRSIRASLKPFDYCIALDKLKQQLTTDEFNSVSDSYYHKYLTTTYYHLGHTTYHLGKKIFDHTRQVLKDANLKLEVFNEQFYWYCLQHNRFKLLYQVINKPVKNF